MNSIKLKNLSFLEQWWKAEGVVEEKYNIVEKRKKVAGTMLKYKKAKYKRSNKRTERAHTGANYKCKTLGQHKDEYSWMKAWK